MKENEQKEKYGKLFENYDMESKIIEALYACTSPADFAALKKEYDEEIINKLFSSKMEANIYPSQLFKKLKAVPAQVDFI